MNKLYDIITKSEEEGIVVDVVDYRDKNNIASPGWLSKEDLFRNKEWERRYA
jgi:hypothetical protein